VRLNHYYFYKKLKKAYSLCKDFKSFYPQKNLRRGSNQNQTRSRIGWPRDFWGNDARSPGPILIGAGKAPV